MQHFTLQTDADAPTHFIIAMHGATICAATLLTYIAFNSKNNKNSNMRHATPNAHRPPPLAFHDFYPDMKRKLTRQPSAMTCIVAHRILTAAPSVVASNLATLELPSCLPVFLLLAVVSFIAVAYKSDFRCLPKIHTVKTQNKRSRGEQVRV